MKRTAVYQYTRQKLHSVDTVAIRDCSRVYSGCTTAAEFWRDSFGLFFADEDDEDAVTCVNGLPACRFFTA